MPWRVGGLARDRPDPLGEGEEHRQEAEHVHPGELLRPREVGQVVVPELAGDDVERGGSPGSRRRPSRASPGPATSDTARKVARPTIGPSSGNSPAKGTFRNTKTPRTTASTTAGPIGTVEPSRPGRTSSGSSAAMGTRSDPARRRRHPKANTNRQVTTPSAESARLTQTSRCGAQCTLM